MNFTRIGLSLTPETISFDHEKREFSKLALNSFLGKFSQKFDQSIQKVVSSEEEIAKYFYSKTFQITDIFALNSFFCQIEVKKKNKTSNNPNRSANCVIGAHIVAFARQFMHQKMVHLVNNGAKLLYSDTDSIIYSLKKPQPTPLTISPAFGDFKFEIDEESTILSYYCLGPKNFALQFIDSKGIYGNIVKLRGLTLSNSCNQNIINTSVYDLYLQQAIKKKKLKISVPQIRVRSSKHTKTKTIRFQKTFFNNSINAKRIIDPNCPNLTTYPYGFNNK